MLRPKYSNDSHLSLDFEAFLQQPEAPPKEKAMAVLARSRIALCRLVSLWPPGPGRLGLPGLLFNSIIKCNLETHKLYVSAFTHHGP